MEPRQAEFAAVFEEHFDYVYRIVSGFFRQSEDVEDIVAETFMQLWQMWDDVEQEKLKQLLRVISRRRVYDLLRKKYKVSLTEIADNFIDESENEQEGHPGRHTAALEKIDQCVAQLSEREQFLFELKYKRNLSFGEIAKELELTLNNVKVINNRLLKKIKQAIWQT
jgi:RNA polymerase sigma-70 factor (ECF subfamily)